MKKGFMLFTLLAAFRLMIAKEKKARISSFFIIDVLFLFFYVTKLDETYYKKMTILIRLSEKHVTNPYMTTPLAYIQIT